MGAHGRPETTPTAAHRTSLTLILLELDLSPLPLWQKRSCRNRVWQALGRHHGEAPLLLDGALPTSPAASHTQHTCPPLWKAPQVTQEPPQVRKQIPIPLKTSFHFFFSLKDSKERVGEREKEIFYPLVHSSNGFNSQGWPRPKPRTSSRAPIWAAQGLWAICCCSSRYVNRELGQKWSI